LRHRHTSVGTFEGASGQCCCRGRRRRRCRGRIQASCRGRRAIGSNAFPTLGGVHNSCSGRLCAGQGVRVRIPRPFWCHRPLPVRNPLIVALQSRKRIARQQWVTCSDRQVACCVRRRHQLGQQRFRHRLQAVRTLHVPIQHAKHLAGMALQHVRVLKDGHPKYLSRCVVARHMDVKVEVAVVLGEDLNQPQHLHEQRQRDRAHARRPHEAPQFVKHVLGTGAHGRRHHLRDDDGRPADERVAAAGAARTRKHQPGQLRRMP